MSVVEPCRPLLAVSLSGESVVSCRQRATEAYIYNYVVLWAWNISNEIFRFVLFFLKYLKANKKKQKNTNYLIIFCNILFLCYFCEMLDCSLHITYCILSRSINKWHIVGAYWQQAWSMTVNQPSQKLCLSWQLCKCFSLWSNMLIKF